MSLAKYMGKALARLGIKADTVEYEGELVLDKMSATAGTKEGQCKWFLKCTRPAVTTVSHPVLGQVPCCQSCADFANS